MDAGAPEAFGMGARFPGVGAGAGAAVRGVPFCGGAAGVPASTGGRCTAPGGGAGTASGDGGASGSVPSSDCGRTSTACVPP
ncbi:hypothetical protein A3Q37_00702 [Streptomyces sp. PTY087I2]|nr:hypothetical protein A3Q37_00702 [Streptomyces sp. PTY087I2]